MSTSIPELWEIYDLSDEELQAALTLASERDLSDLISAITTELSERNVAFSVLAKINDCVNPKISRDTPSLIHEFANVQPLPPPSRDSPKSDDYSPKLGSTAPSAASPDIFPPAPAHPSVVKAREIENADDATTTISTPTPTARLWDESGSSSSGEDESEAKELPKRRKPPPLLKRTVNGVAVLSFGTSFRKKNRQLQKKWAQNHPSIQKLTPAAGMKNITSKVPVNGDISRKVPSFPRIPVGAKIVCPPSPGPRAVIEMQDEPVSARHVDVCDEAPSDLETTLSKLAEETPRGSALTAVSALRKSQVGLFTSYCKSNDETPRESEGYIQEEAVNSKAVDSAKENNEENTCTFLEETERDSQEDLPPHAHFFESEPNEDACVMLRKEPENGQIDAKIEGNDEKYAPEKDLLTLPEPVLVEVQLSEEEQLPERNSGEKKFLPEVVQAMCSSVPCPQVAAEENMGSVTGVVIAKEKKTPDIDINGEAPSKIDRVSQRALTPTSPLPCSIQTSCLPAYPAFDYVGSGIFPTFLSFFVDSGTMASLANTQGGLCPSRIDSLLVEILTWKSEQIRWLTQAAEDPNSTVDNEYLEDDDSDDAVTPERKDAKMPTKMKTLIDPGVDLTICLNPKTKYFKVQRSREEVYTLITDVCSDRTESREEEWVECIAPTWNLWWTWRKPKPKEPTFLAVQRINHIPKSSQLTRKDLLCKHLHRYSRGKGQCAQQFQIMPLTFTLPKEYVEFAKAFSSYSTTKNGQHDPSTNLWIMKTVGMSRGRGISLVSSIEDVTYEKPSVIQRYVTHPYLKVWNGRKFDLRLYVLVTFFDPLECFISQIGFARFAGKPYTTEEHALTDKSVHLTNTAVNFTAETITTKWDLEMLAKKLDEVEGKGTWKSVWSRISDVVLTSLVACEGDIGVKASSNASNVKKNPSPGVPFEFFGFDVLLDDKLKPWVLEVNASPSMEMYGAIDQRLKPSLINDIISLLQIPNIDRDALAETLQVIKKLGISTINSKTQLNATFSRILSGSVPRQYGGAIPSGNSFQRLAPGPAYEKILKQKLAAV